jgi:hypothetical protein
MHFFAKRACACCHSPQSISLASCSVSESVGSIWRAVAPYFGLFGTRRYRSLTLHGDEIAGTVSGERCAGYFRDLFELGLVWCDSRLRYLPYGDRSFDIGRQCRRPKSSLDQFVDYGRECFSFLRWRRSAIADNPGARAQDSGLASKKRISPVGYAIKRRSARNRPRRIGRSYALIGFTDFDK